MPERPTPGGVEERTVGDISVDGRRIRSFIPYGVESRDMGGWRERIEPTAFRNANLEELRAVIDHQGVPLGRYPKTLDVEDRADGLHWSLDPPRSRQDVIEAIERGDMRASSWRMVVAKDRWEGDVRHVEQVSELLDVTLAGAKDPAYPVATVEYRTRPPQARQEETEVDETTEAAAEERAAENENEGAEERTTENGGESRGLAVEDRTVPPAGSAPRRMPDVLRPEERLLDWGEARALPGFTPENRELSFDRLIRGMVTGDWQGAEAEERVVAESPLTAGGHMVPTPVAAQVIDKARNAARVFQAGATTVPMTSQTLKYPRLVTEASPAWRTEGSAVNDQAMTFDAVTLTAQSMAMLVKINVELFEDAPQADGVIRDSFAKQIALELDRVALRGSGTAPEPRGVRNQSGVTLLNHGANGTAIGPLGTGLGYDFLIDAVGAVRAANFEPNAHIDAPRTEQSLQKLKEATTNAYAQPPEGLLPRLPTNQVPTNLTVGTSTDASEVYTAQWDQLLVGVRTQLTIRFLEERFMDQLQYAFLAYLRGDVQLAQPAAFAVDLGVRG